MTAGHLIYHYDCHITESVWHIMTQKSVQRFRA